ncbi:SDR family NAD(P)-dependent oxidoreductase, partial [Escherichia sp. HC-CC]
MDDRFLDYLKDVCSGRVNVIINNIGEGCSKHFLESDDIDIIQTFQINCLSAMRLSRAFLSDMIDKKQGSIINFSSILSQHPVPTVTSYATAKAALVGFTKSLAIEVAPYSIRVNNLTLGYSNTENNKDYFNSENGKNFIKRFIPTKKLVDKNHLGYLLTYLSSDFSTSITGAAIT